MGNKDFDANKPHEENVKASIDKIIGQKTVTKRARKTEEDIKRITFKGVIENLVYAEERQILLMEEYEIDTSKYTSYLFETIEGLFAMMFNREQVNVINFYLYERYTADGGILSLQNDEGVIIPLNTPDDLWEVLKTLK